MTVLLDSIFFSFWENYSQSAMNIMKDEANSHLSATHHDVDGREIEITASAMSKKFRGFGLLLWYESNENGVGTLQTHKRSTSRDRLVVDQSV